MEGVNLKDELDFVLAKMKKKVEAGDIKQYHLDLLEGNFTKDVLDEVNKYFEEEMNKSS